MRRFALLVLATFATGPARADAAVPAEAEAQWHRCVRQSFAVQPGGLKRMAATRAALAACKDAETAYVEALMSASRPSQALGFAQRAQAVLGSMLSHVVTPIAGLFGSWR